MKTRVTRFPTKAVGTGVVVVLLLIFAAYVYVANERGTVGDGFDALPTETRPLHYRFSVTPNAAGRRYSAIEVATFEVVQPTSRIVLHGLGITIESASVQGVGAANVSFDETRERVILRFDRTMAPGNYSLTIRFSAPVYVHEANGVFKRRYKTPAGDSHDALFTMLCCINTGRYFAPLWDEIAAKATFELDLTVDETLEAVSNMPIAKREPAGGGRVRLSFDRTPMMSPYLFFFAIGEFEQLRARVGTTDVGMIAAPGIAQRMGASLDATKQSLKHYEEYFDFKYPLPKLDGIVTSGADGFGGMENFGAIAYSDEMLVIDPGWSTESVRRDAYELVAHEVSHQWLGDLVTAKTWNQIWLHEGFAHWLAMNTAQRFHPEWNMWMQQDGARPRESAMRKDAQAASYAVAPNHSFEQSITYFKGGQVLRMLETYIGAQAFQEAMRGYVRRHAFSTTTTPDVWKALETVTAIPVASIGDDFILQAGVPLIEVSAVTCDPQTSTTQLMIRQTRFGLDERSKASRTWHVPVISAIVGSKDEARRIVSGDRPTLLRLRGCGPVKVNLGETGYFRTKYDDAAFASLLASFDALQPADQLGLLSDSFSLAEGGYTSFGRYLDLAEHVSASADPWVLYQMVNSLQVLDEYFDGSPFQSGYRQFARGRLSRLLTAIGWAARPPEAATLSIVRARLIEALGQLEDAATRSEALRRFNGAEQEPWLMPPPIRAAILRVAGMGADETVLRKLVAQAAVSDNLAVQKQTLAAAASAQSESVVRHALAATLDESIPYEAISTLLYTAARRHPDLVFQFASANFTNLQSRLETGAQGELMPKIASNGGDTQMASRLDAFAASHRGRVDTGEITSARAAISLRSEVRQKRLASVETWIREHTQNDR